MGNIGIGEQLRSILDSGDPDRGADLLNDLSNKPAVSKPEIPQTAADPAQIAMNMNPNNIYVNHLA